MSCRIATSMHGSMAVWQRVAEGLQALPVQERRQLHLKSLPGSLHHLKSLPGSLHYRPLTLCPAAY